MNEKQIKADRQVRATDCHKEIEAILGKYEFTLLAEDIIGTQTKISVNIQLVDLKKYDSPIAQEDKPKA